MTLVLSNFMLVFNGGGSVFLVYAEDIRAAHNCKVRYCCCFRQPKMLSSGGSCRAIKLLLTRGQAFRRASSASCVSTHS